MAKSEVNFQLCKSFQMTLEKIKYFLIFFDDFLMSKCNFMI